MLKHRTLIYLALIVIVAISAFMIKPKINRDRDYIYLVKAQVGTYRGRELVLITDHRGEQFTVHLSYYKVMMEEGYNKVLQNYYTNPHNMNFELPVKLKVEYEDYAFYRSYSQELADHNVYKPSKKIIYKAITVRLDRYGERYAPSNAIPIRVHNPDSTTI